MTKYCPLIGQKIVLFRSIEGREMVSHKEPMELVLLKIQLVHRIDICYSPHYQILTRDGRLVVGLSSK